MPSSDVSTPGSLPPGDMSTVCQSETVLPQSLARFPQQLPLKPEG